MLYLIILSYNLISLFVLVNEFTNAQSSKSCISKNLLLDLHIYSRECVYKTNSVVEEWENTSGERNRERETIKQQK